jgi:membrane peptidoglycan carboxypeptidase
VHADPFAVLKVEDATGQVLYEAEEQTQRAFPATIANEVTYDLAQVVQAGTGAYAQNLGRPAAGKTGNHEGETAWFIGYTPQLVTAVAFHRELRGDPLAPLNGVAYQPVFTGAGYPTQIWTAFMNAALEGTEVLPLPGRPVPTTSPSPTPSPSPTTSSPLPSPTTASPSPSPTKTKPSPSATTASPSPSAEPAGGGQQP